MLTIVHGSHLDVNNVTFAKVKTSKTGGKTIGVVNSQSNGPLILQTPMMLTWGLNENVDKKSGAIQSYTMALQFPSPEYSKPPVSEFLKNIKSLEDKIKSDAVTHSKEWFGKTMSADVVNAIFTPILSYTKNKETGEPDLSKNPTMRLKLPFYDGEWKDLEIYDTTKTTLLFPTSDEKHPRDIITKGSDVTVLITCGGVWIAGGSFGVTWRLTQAVLKPKPSLLGKCHISIDEEERSSYGACREKEEEPVVLRSHSVSSSVSLANEVDVESSDDDDVPQRIQSSTAAASGTKKVVKKK
jgi:hypothetical protein